MIFLSVYNTVLPNPALKKAIWEVSRPPPEFTLLISQKHSWSLRGPQSVSYRKHLNNSNIYIKHSKKFLAVADKIMC